MALRLGQAARKPEIVELFDGLTPRLHWYGVEGHDGAPWTHVAALAGTITELTVHWTEENAEPGREAGDYVALVGKEAHYHAFERNWGTEADPIYGDGLMYHYVITPPDGDGIARIFQTTPETKRTWNAFNANGYNIAICVMAGHGNEVYPATAAKLEELLDWFCYGREDLPGVQAHPGEVQVWGAAGVPYKAHSKGVKTHDESLVEDSQRPVKGCCGIYAPVVDAWRARQ